jgi:carboxylesterase
VLENSYHVATLDNDAPEIFATSAGWIAGHAPPPAGEGPVSGRAEAGDSTVGDGDAATAADRATKG